jgi:hypothetical protein
MTVRSTFGGVGGNGEERSEGDAPRSVTGARSGGGAG